MAIMGKSSLCYIAVALVFIACAFATSEAANARMLRNVAKTWCIANPLKSDENHRKDIDALCGAIDCSPIKPGGACYKPNNVKFHASYVFDVYYKARLTPNSCNFGGDAMFSTTDPSTANCKFP